MAPSITTHIVSGHPRKGIGCGRKCLQRKSYKSYQLAIYGYTRQLSVLYEEPIPGFAQWTEAVEQNGWTWWMYIPDLVQRFSFKKPSRTILKAGSHIRDLQLPGFILFHCPITWAPKNWWLVVFYTATLRSGRTGRSMARSTASTFHQSTVIQDPKTPSNFSDPETWIIIYCVYIVYSTHTTHT